MLLQLRFVADYTNRVCQQLYGGIPPQFPPYFSGVFLGDFYINQTAESQCDAYVPNFGDFYDACYFDVVKTGRASIATGAIVTYNVACSMNAENVGINNLGRCNNCTRQNSASNVVLAT